jgi:hypothetical protein
MPQKLQIQAETVYVWLAVSSVGLKPDVLFTFDIQLPRDFVPKPQDGEVGAWSDMCASYLSLTMMYDIFVYISC